MVHCVAFLLPSSLTLIPTLWSDGGGVRTHTAGQHKDPVHLPMSRHISHATLTTQLFQQPNDTQVPRLHGTAPIC